MIKRVLTFLFFSGLLSLTTSAQLVQDLYKIYNPVYSGSNEADSSYIISPFGIIKPGINYSLSMGAGYTSAGNGVGISGSYIAPSVSYAPNQKFQMVAGVSLSRNSIHGASIQNSFTGNAIPASNPYQVWAYTQYSFSNRFSVYAMGSFSQNQMQYSPLMNNIYSINSQSYSVGFNYRLGSKTTIGASFNFMNNQPLQNAFNNFGNPFFP